MCTPLRQRMIHDMQIRNYSPRTIRVYVHHVAAFAKFCKRSPDQLGPEDVRQFQIHLVEEKKASWTSFNQAVCALRFLYRTTIPRDWPVTMIPFAKKPKKLPVVPSDDEVRQLLECVQTLKPRTILTICYAAGLRLEEALHLKTGDIDSRRMLLRVTHGKGNKERLVPVSPRLLETLRNYWLALRPRTWLFPGCRTRDTMDSSVVQSACQQARKKAGLTKHITPHSLRHAYATGLLEAGVDLLVIGRLLGHRSFASTLIYLHVRRPHLESVPSPLDWLPVDQCPRFGQPAPATPPPQPAAPESQPATAAPTKPSPQPTGAKDSSKDASTKATSRPSPEKSSPKPRKPRTRKPARKRRRD